MKLQKDENFLPQFFLILFSFVTVAKPVPSFSLLKHFGKLQTEAYSVVVFYTTWVSLRSEGMDAVRTLSIGAFKKLK